MIDEYYEFIPCNLCGSTEYKIKYKQTNKNFNPAVIFSASGGIRGTQQIVKCKNCGLIYVNPRIKTGIMISGYSDAVDKLYISQETGRINTFKKSLKLVEKYAPSRGKILDIGAAAGFFLKVAKDAGWEIYGVEPSKWMSDWGNKKFNVNIKNDILKDSKYPPDFFHVVTMWDVLEHTPDPKSELVEVARILKKNGILIINYPNIGSKIAKLAGRQWWFILSVHLYYFNHQTIRSYLEKNGFEVLHIKRYYQTLSLEHLISMIGLYSKLLSRIGQFLVKTLKMNKWQIPYYASQANVIARKK
jgi:2-polyprenyl-3-methyl-5-hydroxy-6-metoxy-1,4-benzoquinol methylase